MGRLGHGIAVDRDVFQRHTGQALQRNGQRAARRQFPRFGRTIIKLQYITADGQAADREGVRHSGGFRLLRLVGHSLGQVQAAGGAGVDVAELCGRVGACGQRNVRQACARLLLVTVQRRLGAQVEQARRGIVGSLFHGVGVVYAAVVAGQRQVGQGIAAAGGVSTVHGHIRAGDRRDRTVLVRHGERQVCPRGGQLLGSQAARYGFADGQICAACHRRGRVGAEPDVVQQIALGALVVLGLHRQEKEAAHILPARDLVCALVCCPVGDAIGHFAADHKSADGHLLAVVLDQIVQGIAHTVFSLVLGGSSQRLGDCFGHRDRRDQQHHRVRAVAALVGQRPVQRGAGHGQHILIERTVGFAVQLGELIAVLGAAGVVADPGVVVF